MKVEGAFPTGEPERRLLLDLVVTPTAATVGSGSVGGPSGAFAVTGGSVVTGKWYDGAGGPGVAVSGALFVAATYIRDPADTSDEPVTPFGKGTYTVVLSDGTITICADAERAANTAAVGGVGFVHGGANQLPMLRGTGGFEGISGAAVINSGWSSALANGGAGNYLDGVTDIKFFRDVQYVGKAISVATGADPATRKPLSFRGSGTSSSAHSQEHADYLAGVEAEKGANTALNNAIALLGQAQGWSIGL